MQYFDIEHEEHEDFGPGFDMAISMFAVALLLLTLAGAGVLQEINTSPPAPPTPAQQPDNFYWEGKYIELNGRFEIAQGQISEKSSAVDAARDRIANLNNMLSAAEQRISSLRSENMTLRAKPDIATTFSLPTQSLTVLAERDNMGSVNFTKDSAHLTPEGKARLFRDLKQSAAKVAALGTKTVLLVEGHSSPEPRQTDANGADSNTLLAFNRANTIGELLVKSGVPRRCITLVSHGRARSKLLTDWNAKWTEEDLLIYDKAWSQNKQAGYRMPNREEKLASERRIEIRAVGDPASICDAVEISAALQRMRS